MINGTNGLSVHLRGEKIGDWKIGKCICCCKLERVNSFEDLIWFLMLDMKEKEFYEAPEKLDWCYIIHFGKVIIHFIARALSLYFVSLYVFFRHYNHMYYNIQGQKDLDDGGRWLTAHCAVKAKQSWGEDDSSFVNIHLLWFMSSDGG